MRIPEDIDLLAEAGVKGNIRVSVVLASLNSISPNIFEKCLYNPCLPCEMLSILMRSLFHRGSSVLICVP